MKVQKIRFIIFILLFNVTNLFGQIVNVDVLTSPIPTSNQIYSEAFQKVELGITIDLATENLINNGLLNPYNPDEVNIWGELRYVQTNQLIKTIYGFYMKEFDVDADGQAINLASTQNFNWRMRFVIEEVGKQYTLTLHFSKNGTESYIYEDVFDVYGERTSEQGYLYFPANKKYLQFTSGTPFFAVGQTLFPYNNLAANSWDASSNSSTGTNYPTNTVSGLNGIINQFADEGGNFLKYYFAPDAIEFEWTQLGNYNDYQNRAHDLDKIVEQLEQRGVYAQFGIWTWEQFNPGLFGELNISWNWSPYKNIPGVSGPMDLFTNHTTCDINYEPLTYLKRKIRYFMARWGYSPNIAAVEIMTEVDRISSNASNEYWNGGCKTAQNAQLVNNAFIYLGSYIKSLSNRMMVTTGAASYYGTGSDFFKSPICDFVDFHAYSSNYVNGGAEHAYIGEYEKREYNKPFHSGETGSGFNEYWYGSIPDINGNDFDPQTQFSNIMWSSAFSGSFGNAMYFGGYGYLHSLQWNAQAYKKFRAFSSFFQQENMNEGKFQSIKNKTVGGMTLNCNGNWVTPECLKNPPTIYSHEQLYAYNQSYDGINGFSQNYVPQIQTSDDENIEVYALRNASRILGWVHNKSNYFYNLPHQGGNTTSTSYTRFMMHPLPNGSLEGNPDQQHYSYVTDLYNNTMTIKGLDCSVPYTIDWYNTRGNGGVITSLTQTGLMPNNGEITVTIPDLRGISDAHNSLPDYAFKIYVESNEGYSYTAEWKTDYMNTFAEPIDGITDIAITNNNRIYYRGQDEKLHCYYWDYGCWNEKQVPVWGPNDDPNNQNTSKFAITPDNKIFYRNRVNRIEQVYEVSPTNNVPNWIANMHTNVPIASSGISTVKYAGNSIFYVSADDYITELYWDGTSWAYRQINWAPKVSPSMIYNTFDVSSDRKVFYRNINGKIEQLWWNANTNSWTAYTHNTAPTAALGSDIKISIDGKVAYESINGYLAILWFDQSTQTWVSQEISWIPKFNTSLGHANISINALGQIFYGNVNNKIQEVYWGSYQGTYQWIGYQIGYQYSGNKMVIANDSKMFYPSTNGFIQIYFDVNTNSWIQFIHSDVNASSLQTQLAIDSYGKIFYANNDNRLLSVLFWDDPCRKYPPCTFTNYRQSSTIVDSQKVEETQNMVFNSKKSIENNALLKYQIYPNPTVYGKVYVGGINGIISIEIKNIYGQTILSAKLSIENNMVDLSNLPNGVYMFICSDSNRSEVHKVVLNN